MTLGLCVVPPSMAALWVSAVVTSVPLAVLIEMTGNLTIVLCRLLVGVPVRIQFLCRLRLVFTVVSVCRRRLIGCVLTV